ncbi:UPF0158 family protein [Flavisolibacter nicotianae]|uniref:UPF0158 family protein n=1 Tax=Flavisolibacter nicotianae TaxID=2364882 RepID=UPI000EB02972|nr:UPF0158 family protein [Flavisolibacter nicotianae]
MTQVPQETVQEIADWLECGFRVFLHRETHKLITYPNEDRCASFEPSMWKKEIQAIRKEREKYLEIEGMEPHESFRVMEDFISTLNDLPLKDRLLRAIDQKKPFAHFKAQIDGAGVYRERWFQFRDRKMREWVGEQMEVMH